jgi:hypothetical protein
VLIRIPNIQAFVDGSEVYFPADAVVAQKMMDKKILSMLAIWYG